MTILVTGGAGFIGSNLVRMLLEETEHTVVNLDNLTYAGNLNSLADVINHPRHCLVKADIADPTAVESVFLQWPVDAVMHLAAESHVDRSIEGPQAFINTNILGTFNLLQSSLKHWQKMSVQAQRTFRFLHISTDEVYGSLAATEPAFTESTSYKPHSPYSASKAASDHLARAWFDTYGLPVLVTNCSNNYGPYQFPEKLVPVVILKCLRGEPVPVYGGGENIRDWLHVTDHCRALRLVLEKGKIGETYNIGGNNEWRNLDLVKLICRLVSEVSHSKSNLEELISFVADRPGHDMRYAINASKILSELGWHPIKSADEGFRQTVEWYLGNSGWWENILDGGYRLNRMGLA